MRKHRDMPKADQRARVHYYKLFRAERPDVPALTTWTDAMRHVYFRQKLSSDVAAYKRRSRAAKRGWATRQAQQ